MCSLITCMKIQKALEFCRLLAMVAACAACVRVVFSKVQKIVPSLPLFTRK